MALTNFGKMLPTNMPQRPSLSLEARMGHVSLVEKLFTPCDSPQANFSPVCLCFPDVFLIAVLLWSGSIWVPEIVPTWSLHGLLSDLGVQRPTALQDCV